MLSMENNLRIAILTNFDEWTDAYSVTHVVHAQALVLAMYGHDVTVFTMEGCPAPEIVDLPFGYRQDACIPRFDYETDYAEKVSEILVQKLSGFDLVITHDWILTDRNRLLAEALTLSCDALRGKPFLHWVHSAAFGSREWWDINRYGPNHKLVYPNGTDLPLVAEKFKASRSQTRFVPHVVDLRILNEWRADTWRIVDAMPGLMEADFVQVYPADRARLTDKGLRELILLFKTIKAQGETCCLLVVDCWLGYGQPEDICEYEELAYTNGLTSREFAFTSTLLGGKFPVGLPKRILRELMQCSSVFVYPTHGEAFGLPLPETCLVSGALPMINGSLPMLSEIAGDEALSCEFGSCQHAFTPLASDYEKAARGLIHEARSDKGWMARQQMKQTLNADAVYEGFCKPLLMEVR